MPVSGNTILLSSTAIILYAQIQLMLFQAKESSIRIDGTNLMLDLLTQSNYDNKRSACSGSVECIQAHNLLWCKQEVSVPM
jgi:Na+-transporting NADH:ubiquinone oxidoreductase subunit NqrF